MLFLLLIWVARYRLILSIITPHCYAGHAAVSSPHKILFIYLFIDDLLAHRPGPGRTLKAIVKLSVNRACLKVDGPVWH